MLNLKVYPCNTHMLNHYDLANTAFHKYKSMIIDMHHVFASLYASDSQMQARVHRHTHTPPGSGVLPASPPSSLLHSRAPASVSNTHSHTQASRPPAAACVSAQVRGSCAAHHEDAMLCGAAPGPPGGCLLIMTGMQCALALGLCKAL